MTPVHRISLALVVGLFLTPAVAAQETDDAERKTSPITFYGHVFATGYDLPMPTNTQFPKGEDNLGLGDGTLCTPAGQLDGGGTGADLPVAGPTFVDPTGTCENSPATKLVLFSTAGPVDIGSRDEFFGGNQYVQLHNERGSTKSIFLDPSQPVTATLFMSLDLHVWYVGVGNTIPGFNTTTSYCNYPNPPDTTCLVPYWGWDPSPMWPDWVVRARLFYSVFGDYGSGATERIPVRESIETGTATLIGEGQVGPAAVTNGLPGSENVNRFEINLGTPKVTTIPKEANFFLVFDWFSESGGNRYATLTWRVWTGEFFPPSFVLPTKNAFDVELVAPVFLHGKLVLLGVINTPWGSYDVDPDATKLVITNAAGKEFEPRTIDTVASYKFAHGAHYKPVNISYIWNYQKDNLPPGVYTATISGANQEGTAVSSCAATFEILAGGRAGDVQVGRCGQVSAQGEELVAKEGGGAPTAGERRAIAQMLPYGLGAEYLAATTTVAPASASSLSILAPATVLVAALGVALRRRWGA